ncbi:MAG: hypothetical protein F7C35_04105 [Desulfurococcales archaeon]|nr:hypothetical protein [Desulfurococcales archaeon]
MNLSEHLPRSYKRWAFAALFVILALYSSYQSSQLLLEWLYRATLVKLHPLILAVPITLVATASLTGRLEAAAAPLVLWAVSASLGVETMYGSLLLALALLPLSRAYYYGGFGGRVSHIRRSPPLPLHYIMLLTLLGILSSLSVYAVISNYDTITRAMLENASGDLRNAYRILHGTLLLSMIIVMLGLYVIYKGIESIAGTGLFAALKPPSLFSVEALRELREWRSKLFFRRRKQEGILRSAQVWIFSLLLSPFLFPVLRILVYSVPGLSGKASIAAYMIVSYIVSWIVLQALYSSLFDPLPLKGLRRPGRVSVPLIVGFIAGSLIVVLYAVVGGDPVQLMLTVLKGRPTGPDPLAEAVDIRGLEEGVDRFMGLIYKLAELGTRFLWGPA